MAARPSGPLCISARQRRKLQFERLWSTIFQDLDVEGPSVMTTGSSPAGPSTSGTVPMTSGSPQVATQCVIPNLSPVVNNSRKKESSFSLKITKAELTSSSAGGKANFEPISTMYLEMYESSANVTLKRAAMQRKWGQEFTLVTSDGVELEESSGTEGELGCTCSYNYSYTV